MTALQLKALIKLITQNINNISMPSMSTPPDYPRVSRIQTKSPGVLYGSPNLPDNTNERA